MTGISSASSSYSYYQTPLKSNFSKLDGDGDGKVSSDEFAAGKPSDVTAKQSSQLFSSLDADGDGSVSEAEMTSSMTSSDPFAQMSGDAVAVMMQMQSASSFGFSSSDAYSEMDADSDGAVTQAEFVSARPDDVSEDDAMALFRAIDTEGVGSISEEQFIVRLEEEGPDGPPPMDDDTTAIFDALDTDQDGVVSAEELAAAKPDDVSAEDSTSLFDALDEDSDGGVTLDEFESARHSFIANTRISAGDEEDEESSSSPSSISDVQSILDTLSSSTTETAGAGV
ncbi:EF-hand domain-containing protein [Rhizobium sp. G21]|uniref:EF-hand domain-containing protein n=1 Tax=Rhizobium sp. G21 TaxID=2758439 RepID=UPI0016036831|nr:EF-hand domain-containing protein [Rhizobium sp. G21]MBB1250478.1 EF-hand domain-containing protein [Rhizobium sp. G21]